MPSVLSATTRPFSSRVITDSLMKPLRSTRWRTTAPSAYSHEAYSPSAKTLTMRPSESRSMTTRPSPSWMKALTRLFASYSYDVDCPFGRIMQVRRLFWSYSQRTPWSPRPRHSRLPRTSKRNSWRASPSTIVVVRPTKSRVVAASSVSLTHSSTRRPAES